MLVRRPIHGILQGNTILSNLHERVHIIIVLSWFDFGHVSYNILTTYNVYLSDDIYN